VTMTKGLYKWLSVTQTFCYIMVNQVMLVTMKPTTTIFLKYHQRVIYQR
jgi:hypothetical protein